MPHPGTDGPGSMYTQHGSVPASPTTSAAAAAARVATLLIALLLSECSLASASSPGYARPISKPCPPGCEKHGNCNIEEGRWGRGQGGGQHCSKASSTILTSQHLSTRASGVSAGSSSQAARASTSCAHHCQVHQQGQSPRLHTSIHMVHDASAAARCRCECPWGLTGPDCSQQQLPACKVSPSSLPFCGEIFPKSCECFRWGSGPGMRHSVMTLLVKCSCARQAPCAADSPAQRSQPTAVAALQLWAAREVPRPGHPPACQAAAAVTQIIWQCVLFSPRSARQLSNRHEPYAHACICCNDRPCTRLPPTGSVSASSHAKATATMRCAGRSPPGPASTARACRPSSSTATCLMSQSRVSSGTTWRSPTH